MSWRLIEKPKTLKVTSALAKKFAEMDPAPHDRPLSERRLMVYERILAEGGFRPVSWATAFCTETGGTYRVNGKHTSTMLSKLNPMPEFFVTLEEYLCDTLEDVSRLYATFDSNMQSRSASDIYLSFAATVSQLRTLPNRYITLAVAGMSVHLNGGSYDNRQTSPERAETLLEYPEFVMWLSEILSSGREGTPKGGAKDVMHIRRAAVVGAMMGCWQKAKGAAEEFWIMVRDETGKDPNTPDRKLARYLSTTGMRQLNGRGKIKQATAKEMYVKCIHAWNAWRKGENTSLAYFAEAEAPAFK